MENKIDLRTLEEVNSTEIKNVVALNSEGNIIKADLSNVINAVNQHADDIDSVIFEVNETNDNVNSIKADLQALEERVDNIPTTGGTGDVTREEFELIYRNVAEMQDDIWNLENSLDDIEETEAINTKEEFRNFLSELNETNSNKIIVGGILYIVLEKDSSHITGIGIDGKNFVYTKWENSNDNVTVTSKTIPFNVQEQIDTLTNKQTDIADKIEDIKMAPTKIDNTYFHTLEENMTFDDVYYIISKAIGGVRQIAINGKYYSPLFISLSSVFVGVSEDLTVLKFNINFDNSVTFTKSQITTTPIN